MAGRLRFVAYLIVLAAMMAGAAPLTMPSQAEGVCRNTSDSRLIEGRMMKLHMVRPDLVVYPMEFEVYC